LKKPINKILKRNLEKALQKLELEKKEINKLLKNCNDEKRKKILNYINEKVMFKDDILKYYVYEYKNYEINKSSEKIEPQNKKETFNDKNSDLDNKSIPKTNLENIEPINKSDIEVKTTTVNKNSRLSNEELEIKLVKLKHIQDKTEEQQKEYIKLYDRLRKRLKDDNEVKRLSVQVKNKFYKIIESKSKELNIKKSDFIRLAIAEKAGVNLSECN